MSLNSEVIAKFGSQYSTTEISDAINVQNVKLMSAHFVWTNDTPSGVDFISGEEDVDITNNQVTITSHGLVLGVKGQLTTDGTLPAGLATSTDYFIIVVDANTVKFASSLANAQAGTAVDITDVGSVDGTHTFTATAVAGASVKLQASNDKVNWIDIANTDNNITADSQALESVEDVSWVWVRAYFTATAGMVGLTATFCIKYEV